jgi:hypothetical protein
MKIIIPWHKGFYYEKSQTSTKVKKINETHVSIIQLQYQLVTRRTVSPFQPCFQPPDYCEANSSIYFLEYI